MRGTVNNLKDMNLATLARVIAHDWPKVMEAGEETDFGTVGQHPANPYWAALSTLDNIEDRYGDESGKSIVRYFLANASGWRGGVARNVKTELKRRLA